MTHCAGRIRAVRWGLPIVIALATMLLSASIAWAAPGDLDTSFGTGGKQTLNFGGEDRASHVVVTPDGRIVVVGSTTATGGGDFAVARFTANGAPDTSFNGTGRVSLSTAPNVSDVGGGVAVLPDERIAVAGAGNATIDFVTKQLNADGSLDATFGTAGTSVVEFGATDIVNAMIRQPDGKLVLVGTTGAGNPATTGDFAIARLNADGSLDTTFGAGGKQTVDFGGLDSANAVAIQPDGKLIVAGQGGPGTDMAVTRLNPDGSIDTSFAPLTSGKAFVDFGGTDGANAMALQPDGKIVLNGSTTAAGSGDFAIARLNADGSLDPTFSGDGMETLGYAAP
ncbi:MAG TPA: delta-60 repeat domain-containing protein, partial [Acidimicrobiales bacterium]